MKELSLQHRKNKKLNSSTKHTTKHIQEKILSSTSDDMEHADKAAEEPPSVNSHFIQILKFHHKTEINCHYFCQPFSCQSSIQNGSKHPNSYILTPPLLHSRFTLVLSDFAPSTQFSFSQTSASLSLSLLYRPHRQVKIY